jgi:hypothetical protein
MHVISKIAATTAEAEYQQLVEMPEAGSKNEVLKRGVELGKLLAGLVEMEEMVWEVLAAFWSDIMLYAAPSDNIDGHLEAVAQGGKLITLLWALLMHVGIVNRPEATAAATDGVVVPAGQAWCSIHCACLFFAILLVFIIECCVLHSLYPLNSRFYKSHL